jgi:GNAT superfamily N-acetyltransferase
VTAAARAAIEPGKPADVDELAAVQLRSALDAYAHIFPSEAPVPQPEDLARAWGREMSSKTADVIVARAGSAVIGGVVASTDDRVRGLGHLRRLYVDPEWWGEGTGRALHDAALRSLVRARVRRPSLWVLEQNDRARRMYERWGWQLVPGDRFEHDGLPVAEVRYVLDRFAPTRRLGGASARR